MYTHTHVYNTYIIYNIVVRFRFIYGEKNKKKHAILSPVGFSRGRSSRREVRPSGPLAGFSYGDSCSSYRRFWRETKGVRVRRRAYIIVVWRSGPEPEVSRWKTGGPGNWPHFRPSTRRRWGSSVPGRGDCDPTTGPVRDGTTVVRIVVDENARVVLFRRTAFLRRRAIV